MIIYLLLSFQFALVRWDKLLVGCRLIDEKMLTIKDDVAGVEFGAFPLLQERMVIEFGKKESPSNPCTLYRSLAVLIHETVE
mmetsp:Transcript_17983/g.33328  ORF Transcript_17983/g.33328 Transcript_17983/m.33328 type:complete len:82 (+) Transcript_17983:642-887(+)